MRRPLPTLVRPALTAFAALVALATALLVPAAAHAAGPSLCTTVATIEITGLSFSPPSIPAGNSSTAKLAAHNCTAQDRPTTATWQGRFASPTGTGIPAGCPAIDPLPMSIDFPPYGSVSRAVTYFVFAGCTATVLHLTVTISAGGQILATRSADLAITH
jgi:hypothetical protein